MIDKQYSKWELISDLVDTAMHYQKHETVRVILSKHKNDFMRRIDVDYSYGIETTLTDIWKLYNKYYELYKRDNAMENNINP